MCEIHWKNAYELRTPKDDGITKLPFCDRPVGYLNWMNSHRDRILTRLQNSLGPRAVKSYGLRDSSPRLLLDGYDFWPRLRQKQGSDTVRTRLMGSPVACVYGEEAARFFYTEPSLERSTALPELVVGSLFGRGAVHTLDGAQHQSRKSLFTSLLDAQAVADISSQVRNEWDRTIAARGSVNDLFTETSEMLVSAACEWLGLDLLTRDVPRRAADMVAMIDGFGSVGPRQVKARLARRRSEQWIEGAIGAAPGRALSAISTHQDEDAGRLSAKTAAVEVINLIRPTVAISWFVAYSAHALGSHPELRGELTDGEFTPVDFAHEVRRRYPFAPFLMARASKPLTQLGLDLPEGGLIALDLWATNHDPRLWDDPLAFSPQRFRDHTITPYDLIPQGGGDAETGHRCPGEDTTIAVLATLVPRLADLDFTFDRVPPSIETGRFPARLRGRVTGTRAAVPIIGEENS